VGCGNGWLERQLIDEGITDEIDAFDADTVSIEQARQDRGDRRINYFVADFRSFRPAHTYDLVINYAALHHAAWLYRHCHRLAQALSPDGIFVNWDYVGTDRNQYDEQHLRRLSRYNVSMPERFRTFRELRPSLRVALKFDPTEAVHASEIVRALENEFEIVIRRDLGGGLAYPLLWNNIGEFEQGDEESQQVLSDLLTEDERVTRAGDVATLFTFIVARPRTRARRLHALVDLYAREPLREATASRIGELYPHEMTATIRRYQLWRPQVLVPYLRKFWGPKT